MPSWGFSFCESGHVEFQNNFSCLGYPGDVNKALIDAWLIFWDRPFIFRTGSSLRQTNNNVGKNAMPPFFP